MKYIMEVTDDRHEKPWTEDENDSEVNNDAEAFAAAQLMIDNFNAGLRPGERARTLLSAVVVSDDESNAHESHDWHKTNAMTVSGRAGTYDTMRCERCFITGKRHGISEVVKRDADYKAKAFEKCDTARAQLEKRRKKAGQQ